jgi:hypothetical protein
MDEEVTDPKLIELFHEAAAMCQPGDTVSFFYEGTLYEVTAPDDEVDALTEKYRERLARGTGG